MENIDVTIDTSVDDNILNNPNITTQCNSLLSPSDGNNISDSHPMTSLQPSLQQEQQGQQLPPPTPTSTSKHNPTLASADLLTAPFGSTTIMLPNGTIIHSVTNPVVQPSNFGQLYTKEICAKLTTKDRVAFVVLV